MQYGKLRPNRRPRVIDDFFFVKLVWLKHLQHQYRRKVLGQNLFQHQLDVREQMTKDDRQTLRKSQTKFFIWITKRYGETRIFRNTRMAARIQRESCG